MRYTFPPIDSVMRDYQTGAPTTVTAEDGSEVELTVRLIHAPNAGSSRLIGCMLNNQSVAGLLRASGTAKLCPVSVSFAEQQMTLTTDELATIQREIA